MTPAALVLAGRRPGPPGPLELQEGVEDKALIVVGGQTMLARAVAAVRAAGCARVLVAASGEMVAEAARALSCEVIEAAAGPSESVARALAEAGAPLLVTTADHALLRPEWIAQFLRDADQAADVAALLARRETVAAAVESKRTWLRFADGDWSGCNLFLLATPAAAGAIALWRLVEADRKRPWRIVRRLGPGLLLRYLTGRLTLANAVAALGRRAGVRAAIVASDYGLAAVDVDKPDDLSLVRRLARESEAVEPAERAAAEDAAAER